MQVNLHERQQEIYLDNSRFKVVSAGRRFGKSFLAAVMLLVEASKIEKTRSDGTVVDLSLEEVYYVGPTFDQSKKIMWPVIEHLGGDLIARKQEMIGVFTLVNGRRISIKGSDRPDNLRGTGLSFVVMDEYAFMKEEVWEVIIEPQLLRSEGCALFIGTPDGKNHFYDLWQRGQPGAVREDGSPWVGWKSWNFPSSDNPYNPRAEIEAKRASLSKARFAQEYLADFESGGNAVINPGDFVLVEKLPGVGDKYIAIDLAGFESAEGGRTMAKRDSHSITVVHNHRGGWCIERIIHGQWDTRETALRIVKAYKDYKPLKLGIEKGMAKNAVMPYLNDMMEQFQIYFEVTDLSHGNQRKTDRIAWALQGRSEKGKIQLLQTGIHERDEWIPVFLQQCSDFPNQLAHDDLIDSTAYIDQLATPYYDGPTMETYWEPMDDVAHY